MNFNFYKLFNPELKKLNNSQLKNHWNIIGSKNNLLCSVESFLQKYYYYNHDSYKLYNPDIKINDKSELMAHWHLTGNNEYRICSDEHFSLLYPEFDIKNFKIINGSIYEFKNLYHKNKINNIENNYLKNENNNLELNSKYKIKNLLNFNKETIGIIINNSNTVSNNFFTKALSLIDHHNMNIVLFIDNIDNIINIEFLKYINYFIYNDYSEKELCDYLILDDFDNIANISLQNFKKIFIYNENIFSKILEYNNNIYVIDDLFDNNFLENNILITEYDNYIISNNKLYKIDNNIKSILSNIHNKLYISNNFLKYTSYKKIDLTNYLKIIKYNSSDIIEDNNYGIINYKNNYYYKFFNKYSIIDLNNLKINMPINIDHIYIEENINEIKETHKTLNFKINILFIIDQDNKDKYIYNLLFLLKQNYDNYNLIIFLNNILINNIEKYKKKDNIFIFKSTSLLNKIDIILFLNELASDNSLTLLIDNNYLINPLFSLEFINKIFFSKKILFSDYYSNKNSNILTFKKELLTHFTTLNKVDNNKIFEILINFLKKKTDNKNFLKNYNKNLLHKDYFCLKSFNIMDNYISKFMDNYSDEKVNIINKNFNINLSNIKKIVNIEDEFKELNFLIDSYKNNIINYYYFENNLIKKIKNIVCENQIIIFINSSNNKNEDYYTNIKKYKDDLNINYQINIIEFGSIIDENLDFYDNNNINYYFLNTINFDKNKLNQLFAYNLISKIFIKYIFNYENLIFCNFDIMKNLNEFQNINKNLLMKNIDKIIFINKYLFESVGYFDNELFNEYNEYSINYFFEKVRKKCNSKNYEINDLIKIKSPSSSFEDLEVINNDNNIQINYILKSNKHDNILFDFIIKRNNIDYNLNNNIKTVIINLDHRTDRLLSVIKECEKIGIYNYEKFSGIIINENNYRNYRMIDQKKAWKKDIEYLKKATGCKSSHLEVLKKYQYCNEEYIMVLEDDVVFESNTIIYLNFALNYLIKNDSNFDILYLSVNLKNKDDAKLISNNLLKIDNGLTTTAQIFKKSNIDKIINVIECSDIEIDNTYNKCLSNKYCVYPMCTYQKESYSDINNEITNYGLFHKKFYYEL
jgi:GR25 family glycosyltransferase involved in LPS biosynthesis